jgi:RimJ/RimL family protein N-acetyltransferase
MKHRATQIPMLIEDGAVGLRAPEPSDAPYYWKMRSDLAIARQLISYNRGVSLKKIEKWIDGLRDDPDQLIFTAVETRGRSRKPIGYLKAFKFDHAARSCWFGLALFERARAGKGYGTRMLRLMIDYLRDWQNVRKISLEVLDDNAPAIAIYRRAGFVEEGRLKDQYFLDGKLRSVILMALFVPPAGKRNVRRGKA